MTNLDPILRVGDKLIGSYNFDISNEQSYIAPGHNSLLVKGEDTYLVHHARIMHQQNYPFLNIRKIYHKSKGKILLSPFTYDGYFEEIIGTDAEFRRGNFKYLSLIYWDPFNEGIIYGRKMPCAAFDIKFEDGLTFLNINDTRFSGFTITHKDEQAVTLSDDRGEQVWGMFFE